MYKKVLIETTSKMPDSSKFQLHGFMQKTLSKLDIKR